MRKVFVFCVTSVVVRNFSHTKLLRLFLNTRSLSETRSHRQWLSNPQFALRRGGNNHEKKQQQQNSDGDKSSESSSTMNSNKPAGVPQPQHIRPKVRRHNNNNNSNDQTTKVDVVTTDGGSGINKPISPKQGGNDTSTSTKQRMDAWMGIGGCSGSGTTTPEKKKVNPNLGVTTSSSSVTASEKGTKPTTAAASSPGFSTVIVSNSPPPTAIAGTDINRSSTDTDTSSKPASVAAKGILKKAPKYSSSPSTILSSYPSEMEQPTPPESTKSSKPIIRNDIIVERDPSRPLPPRSVLTTIGSSAASGSIVAPSGSVEGYVPKFSMKLEKKMKKKTIQITEPPTKNEAPQSVTTKAKASRFSKEAPRQQQQPMMTSVASSADEISDVDAKRKSAGDGDINHNDDALVISSVAELFEFAGHQLPDEVDPTKITTDTKMLEADISFTCMTAEQYQQTKDQERTEQYEVFMGRQDIFTSSDNDIDNDNPSNEMPEDEARIIQSTSENQESVQDNGNANLSGAAVSEFPEYDGNEMEDDNDDLMDMLMGGSDDDGSDAEDEESDVEPPEPRAFLKLWNVLSEWITPEAMDWLARLSTELTEARDGNGVTSSIMTDWTPQVDRTDIGASRYAGLIAMIKMNIPKCLSELNQPEDMRRTAERRLADLLRTFDYSRPMAKLDLRLWRAMTCVLLDMVLIVTPAAEEEIPSECQAPTYQTTLPIQITEVGMSLEEYRYLTRSAIQSLGKK